MESIEEQDSAARNWLNLIASNQDQARVGVVEGHHYAKIDLRNPPNKDYKILSFNELIKQTKDYNFRNLWPQEKGQLRDRLVTYITAHSEKLHKKGRVRRNLIRLSERIRNWNQHFKTSIGLAKEILAELADPPEGNLSKRGIVRPSNTCYMISSLHLLKVMPNFRKALKETKNQTPLQKELNNLLIKLEKRGSAIPSKKIKNLHKRCVDADMYPATIDEQFDPVEWITGLAQRVTPDHPLFVSNQGIDLPLYSQEVLDPQAVWDHNSDHIVLDGPPPQQLIQQLNRNPVYGQQGQSIFEIMKGRVQYCRDNGGDQKECEEVIRIIGSYPKDLQIRENGRQFLHLYKRASAVEKYLEDVISARKLEEEPQNQQDAERLENELQRQNQLLQEELQSQKTYLQNVLKNFDENGDKSFFEHVLDEIGNYQYPYPYNHKPGDFELGKEVRKLLIANIRDIIAGYPDEEKENTRHINFLRDKLQNKEGPVFDYIRKQLDRDFSGRTKDATPFDFTQELTVPNPFAENGAPTHKRYRAKAVILHRGERPTSGHYRALVREGEKWWLYDDDRISFAKGATSPFQNLQEYQRQAFAILWEEIPSK